MEKAMREQVCEGSLDWFFMYDMWTMEMAAALPQLSVPPYLQSDMKGFEMRSEIMGKENF